MDGTTTGSDGWMSSAEAARLCGRSASSWQQLTRRRVELRATRRHRPDGRTWEYRRDVVEVYADRPEQPGKVD